MFNTYKFSNHDIKRFIVSLWKVVYLYESLHEKPYFRFSNDLERWSFQKNRIGIWSFFLERLYFFSPKIWSYALNRKWKMNFSQNTWKYDIFFKCFEKMVFPKNCAGIWFSLYHKKRWHFFSRIYDNFSIAENRNFVKMVLLFSTHIKLPFCHKKQRWSSQKKMQLRWYSSYKRSFWHSRLTF